AKVGVFGVATPDAVTIVDGARKIEATDPVAAGKRAVDTLRKGGAQVVIGLLQTTSKRDAVALMRDIGGIDLAVAGLGAVAPEPDRIEIEPTKVGNGWLVVPGNRGQVVSRFDVWVRPGEAPLVDAIGPAAAQTKIAQIEREVTELDGELAQFAKDKDADPKFV